MYSEGELDPVLRSYLEEAISKDELISVRSLCSPFSAYSEKASLSYAQSYSLVVYLLGNYGQDNMLDLLTVLKQGNTYDEALTEVYGFDIDGLDALWRATLTSDTLTAFEDGQPGISEIAVFAIIAAALALRFWRRPAGKSGTKDRP